MVKEKYLLNLDRINFLINFYKITREKFLEILNKGITVEKNRLNFEDLRKKIEISKLKKLDEVFNKGLTWYISNKPVKEIKNSSIFFRKKNFNNKDLNLEDIKIITKLENKKINSNILSKNINFNLDRKLKIYKLEDNEREVAEEVREKFVKIGNQMNFKKIESDLQYLKKLFKIIESFNVFVFEKYDTWNKIERTTFEGLYLKNMIILDKQDNIRREIFTLLHELGHHLLEEEEIDKDIENSIKDQKIEKIEKWCNNFAFYFLLNNEIGNYKNISFCNNKNNYNKNIVFDIVNKTYLNSMSIYTHLLVNKKIDREDYIFLKEESDKKFFENERIKKEKLNKISIENAKKEILKKGLEINEENLKKFKKGGMKLPIKSELYENIVNLNFSYGKINEIDLCNYLDFSKDKRKKFLEELYI